jgi:hypothetical protein
VKIPDRQQIDVPEPPTVSPRSLQGGQTDYQHVSDTEEGGDAIAGIESVPTWPNFERPPLTFDTRPVITPGNWTQGTKLINMRLDVGSTTPQEVLTPFIPDDQGFGRKAVTIFNNSAVTVFVSGAPETCNVNWAMPILTNAALVLDREMSFSLWMLAASGASNDVRLMIETGYLGYRVASKIVSVGPMGVPGD